MSPLSNLLYLSKFTTANIHLCDTRWKHLFSRLSLSLEGFPLATSSRRRLYVTDAAGIRNSWKIWKPHQLLEPTAVFVEVKVKVFTSRATSQRERLAYNERSFRQFTYDNRPIIVEYYRLTTMILPLCHSPRKWLRGLLS